MKARIAITIIIVPMMKGTKNRMTASAEWRSCAPLGNHRYTWIRPEMLKSASTPPNNITNAADTCDQNLAAPFKSLETPPGNLIEEYGFCPILASYLL